MKTFEQAVTTIRSSNITVNPDSLIMAASILVLADTIASAISSHGDDVMRGSSDIASSIERAGNDIASSIRYK